MPYASTYRRELRALRDHRDADLLLAGMAAENVHHNWMEMNDFATGALACRLGDITFLNTRTTSSVIQKGGASGDLVGIARVSDGGARIKYAGDALEITAGDCLTFTATQSFKCRIPDYLDKSLVMIPGSYFRRLGLGDALLRTDGEIIARDVMADILFDHLHAVAERLDRGPSLSRTALVSISETITQLAAAALQENTPAKGTELMVMAKAFIDDHLNDLDLSPSAVAAELHVSMRTLYRSFSVSDHGVAEYIRNTRLHRAKRELAMAGSAANINAVARRWGFCDKSYFAKLFRQQFGCLPSDYIRGV